MSIVVNRRFPGTSLSRRRSRVRFPSLPSPSRPVSGWPVWLFTRAATRPMVAHMDTDPLPEIDASGLDCITDDHARSFHENGLLVLPTSSLRRARGAAPGDARARRARRPRAARRPRLQGEAARADRRGSPVPRRVRGRQEPGLRRAARAPVHPPLGREDPGTRLCPDLGLVFKLAGAGASIPWHRNQQLDYELERPIFNVDFYLDESDLTNCLWGLPARATVERLSEGGFRTEGAVPLTMAPGDVLGSGPAQSGLRRVLYYEFRPIETELRHGPHVPEYVPLKQRVVAECACGSGRRRRTRRASGRSSTRCRCRPGRPRCSGTCTRSTSGNRRQPVRLYRPWPASPSST